MRRAMYPRLFVFAMKGRNVSAQDNFLCVQQRSLSPEGRNIRARRLFYQLSVFVDDRLLRLTADCELGGFRFENNALGHKPKAVVIAPR
jgi:hypothetical protein